MNYSVRGHASPTSRSVDNRMPEGGRTGRTDDKIYARQIAWYYSLDFIYDWQHDETIKCSTLKTKYTRESHVVFGREIERRRWEANEAVP